MSRSPWDLGIVKRDVMPAPVRMIGFPSDGGLLTSGITSTTVWGLSAFWRGLDILCNGVSQCPWREVRSNLELPPSRLVTRPLAAATRREWTSYVVASLVIFDIAYLLKVGGTDAEGVPIGLWPLDPSTVQGMATDFPILPFTTPDTYYVGQTKVARDDLVILRRSPNPGISDGMGGVLRLAKIKFAEAMAADAYASRYWQGGGAPTTALETDQVLPGGLAQELADRWAQSRQRGPDHPAVMEGGIKARDFGADPTQQAAVEARKELVADIGRYLGIPTHQLNSPQGDSETYSSTESGNQDLVRYTLQNYLSALEDAISDQLPGGRRLFIDPQRLTEGTFLARAQSYQLLTNGKAVFSVDEVRERYNLGPVENPDELNPPAPAPVVAAATGGRNE